MNECLTPCSYLIVNQGLGRLGGSQRYVSHCMLTHTCWQSKVAHSFPAGVDACQVHCQGIVLRVRGSFRLKLNCTNMGIPHVLTVVGHSPQPTRKNCTDFSTNLQEPSEIDVCYGPKFGRVGMNHSNLSRQCYQCTLHISNCLNTEEMNEAITLQRLPMSSVLWPTEHQQDVHYCT